MDKQDSGVQQFSLADSDWQGITLTEAAAKQVSHLTENGQQLHLTTKVSGCTGYAYELSLVDQPSADDLRFESHGAVIYVALSAMPMLDGTEIDYVRDGLNHTFSYNNPKVKNECGCGESFGV